MEGFFMPQIHIRGLPRLRLAGRQAGRQEFFPHCACYSFLHSVLVLGQDAFAFSFSTHGTKWMDGREGWMGGWIGWGGVDWLDWEGQLLLVLVFWEEMKYDRTDYMAHEMFTTTVLLLNKPVSEGKERKDRIFSSCFCFFFCFFGVAISCLVFLLDEERGNGGNG